MLVLDRADQVRSPLPAEPECRIVIAGRSGLLVLDEVEHVP
ncbi:hypothetical protein [Amycolatopsis benzoatilytica]|nr:hypothetical protein [Amycolatopsis benzoatilytica]